MKRESGFTLFEILLVATLLGIIVAVIVPNLGVGFRIWSSTGESMEIIQDSRITLQKMMKDIRNAEEITDISSESISLIDENGDSIDYGLFYSDGEPYLGYSLNGSEWSKLTGPLDWIQMEYYDQSGEPTDQPSLVRSVKISFSVGGNEFSSNVYRPTGEEIDSDSPSPFPTYAITAGTKKVELKSNSAVLGSNGSVRANCDITLKNNVYVAGDVISAGVCTLVGHPIVDGTVQSYAGEIDIPVLDPWALQDQAQYVLSSDGKVYDDEGNLVGEGELGPWKFKGGKKKKWELKSKGKKGSKECNGIYFVETDVDISGNVYGMATVISTGEIKTSGTVALETATEEGYLLVAAKKINISGSGIYEGIVWGKKVELKGSVLVKGALIGDEEVKTSGSSAVKFNGEYQIPGAGEAKLHILSWDEE